MTQSYLSLCFRLEAYERNSSFGRPITDSTPLEYIMACPDRTLYKDLNLDSPLPAVTRKDLDAHLRAEDGFVEDVSRQLYQERYLRFCRWALDHQAVFLFMQRVMHK